MYFKSPKSSFKQHITIFVVYVILSIVHYVFNGVPFTAYYFDIRSVLCPMLFVYVGLNHSDSNIYKIFVLSAVFLVGVGLLLYLIQPGWYLTFRTNVTTSSWFMEGSNVSEANVMLNGLTSRFASFMGNAYPVAYYSIFSLCILFCDVYKDTDNRIFKSTIVQLSMIGILVIGIMMTLTRIAILYLFALIGYFFVYGFVYKNPHRRIFMCIVLMLICLLVVVLIKLPTTEYGAIIIDRLIGRLGEMSVSDAMEGSRTSQSKIVLDSWGNYLLGEGMGSRGGAVRPLGLPGITDGNWVRWLVEYGLIGMLLFLIPLIKSVCKAFRYRRYYMIELLIIIYTLLSMVVADSLSKGHMILIFWYAMGRIWNVDYKQELIKNNVVI